MKKLVILVVLAGILFGGCSENGEGDISETAGTTAGTTAVTTTIAETTTYREMTEMQIPEEESKNISIKKITREEAGLDVIVPLDFSGKTLDSDIKALLYSEREYVDGDYSNGLIYKEFNDSTSMVIISERFLGSIIENVKIGDTAQKLVSELGEPNIKEDYPWNETLGYYYKTNEYYIGFELNKDDEIALAAICLNLNAYYGNMKELFEWLSTEPYFPSMPEEFFNYGTVVHGGVITASTIGKGLNFLDKFITVYNNFEGDIYSFEGDTKYEVRYENSDYYVYGLWSQLYEYNHEVAEFKERGITSPGGKYTVMTFWNYYMSHGILIRTNDFSKPVNKIYGGGGGTYLWLSDNLLYGHVSNYGEDALFAVYDVDNDDFMYPMRDLGLEEMPGIYDFDYVNPEFAPGQIVLYGKEDKESSLIINYSIDVNGDMIVKSYELS
ncbi:MAG: hypothetical protein FWG90_09315 [Oscillospiraceae bacterium]|nr:hypothetical protein [Oscillospiraceae bacterium]